MVQIRNVLGLVIKHVSGGSEMVYAVYNVTGNPPPLEEYYFNEESYDVNDKTGGFQPITQGSNMYNWDKDHKIKGQYLREGN